MLQSRTRIGELDREITFIEATTTVGTSNEDKITSWAEITDGTVSAKKIENGGSTSVLADRITWNQQTTWIIRHRSDLNVRMRLVYSTQMYEILNIADHEEGRGRFLNITTQILDNEYFT